MMRSITGVGENKGPWISFHDGFVTIATNVTSGGWNGFLNGWDRVALDSHRYLSFSEPNNFGLSYQASLVRSLP
jgi:glucan 1,3-beta-glucosidase